MTDPTLACDSLIALLKQIRERPNAYPSARNIIKLLQPLVGSMVNDPDRCAASDQLRVRINDKRYAVTTLLYNLCYHPDSVFRYTMLENTCSTVNCVNPRHKALTLQRKKRKPDEWRPTTEMLRRAYPTSESDVRLVVRVKRAK